ncbi:single-stranded DNA-binding protein [Macrococcus armenti]|uniref:single-stranded DNA-binding protein n=1 Tax=Macrococcus armenti TaxID=2875764 RepID=UPI001CCDC17B|nr:single-stranded DNA-binding protein [Macrococcus armenti]UBH09797.1 single-stranded DNA-binding protein [Macrococcus armenti]
MINKVIYAGRIATDLKLGKTKNDKSFIFFNIAVDRKHHDKTDFINCIAWNKVAENLVKYQSKGNFIIVEGSTETYVDKNNNNNSRCLVENITYTQSNKNEDNKENDIISTVEHDSNYSKDDLMTDDDLPF